MLNVEASLPMPDKIQFILIVGVTIYDSSVNNETELFQDGNTGTNYSDHQITLELLKNLLNIRPVAKSALPNDGKQMILVVLR